LLSRYDKGDIVTVDNKKNQLEFGVARESD